MTHVTRDDAGRWVAGLLEGAEAEALEAHVAECRECEALLQGEARAEVLLSQVATRAPRWMTVAVPLAAAALLALAVARSLSAGASPPDAGAPAVTHVLSFEVPRYEGEAHHTIMSAPAEL